MIVFDLRCRANGHVFEAWFASSQAWEEQRARALVHCPYCDDTEIEKAVMAPRIPRKGNQKGEPATPVALPADAPEAARAKAVLAALSRIQGDMLKDSTWVGRQFHDKARAMEAGEMERQTIHGQVSQEEARSLIEDGIGVLPLPFPVIPPDQRN